MKEILITSSVLIVALLLLRWFFAKKVSRRLIYGAWVLVALRLLIPVQIGQLDFSVLTAAMPVTEAISQVVEKPVSGQTKEDVYTDIVVDYIEKDPSVFIPEVQEQIREETQQGTINRQEILDKIQQKHPEREIFVPEVQQQVQQQVEQTADPITLGQIAVTLWLTGVAIMAVWFAIVNLRHCRMLRKNREKLDVDSAVAVYISEEVATPCLVGLFRPVVYLTPESAENPVVRRHVLTHELTHYRHKDHIWSLVRCVCLCVYWFNPLVWVAAWFSRRDCELACDEGALRRLGENERIAYGESLLDVVSRASRPANLMQTATAMNETKKQLKERVNFIVKKRKISLIAGIAMVLVCAIVAGCAAAGPSASSGNWEQVKRQIQEDAVRFFSTETDTCQPEEVKLRLISRFDDTYVMFVDMPFLGYLTWIETEEINGLEFVYPSSQKMWVYKDGSFTMLKAAFEAGMLTEKQLQKVWENYQDGGSTPSVSVPEPGPTNPPQEFKQAYLLTQIRTEWKESPATRNAVLSYDDEWNLTEYVIYCDGNEDWRNCVETNTEERTIKVYSEYSALLEEYAYDAEGKITNKIEYGIEKRHNETEYFYDASGRLLKAVTLEWNGMIGLAAVTASWPVTKAH